MSGGIAYVLDDDGGFRSRVNVAMLDQLEELTDADAAEALALITEHRDRTGSPVAQRVIDDWERYRARFAKIFPADYKRVLAEQAAESASSEAVPA
jgi:glutamate synthase (NADPH/NADH) large chain/glutamate synthase (ferredoxin)